MNRFLEEDIPEPAHEGQTENQWDGDDISISSDFDLEDMKTESNPQGFSTAATSHANCIPLDQYNREKQEWEKMKQEHDTACETVRSLEKKVQKYEQLVNMLQNGMQSTGEEKGQANEEEMKQLKQQLEETSSKLQSSLDELSRCKDQMKELEKLNIEFEEKLYGPMNYYYAEYKKLLRKYEELEQEKKDVDDQLQRVKEIMRSMILEQTELPTADEIQKERESFAEQITLLQKRVNELEEENRRLQSKNE